MRVLHICTDDSKGAGQCCLRIHRALLGSGVESKVLVLNNTQHEIEEYSCGFLKNLLDRVLSKALRSIGLKITERNRLLDLAAKYQGAYSLPVSSINLLKNKWVKWADVIHLHWVNNFLDYPSFFKGVNKPIVWTLHDENFFLGISHYTNQVIANNKAEIKYLEIKQEAYSNIEKMCIVMLSIFFYNKFGDHTLLRNRKTVVINNPVDTNSFSPYNKMEARRKLHLNDEDIYFAFTALDIAEKRKGLNVLSEALIEMNDPRMKVLAIGGNPSKVEWPNVISLGSKSSAKEISEVLSSADYYAMPSYQEAFSQSPMEAMACGLPVVAFPVSGTAELINDHNGVVCDDFTADSLKEGIQKMMGREYDPRKIREDMINRFSPEAIAQKYIEIYNKL